MRKAPLRVAFLSPYADLAGSERYLEILLDALGEEAIADIVCLREGPFVGHLQARGYEVTAIATSPKMRDMMRSARRLRRRWAEIKPDLVHANGVKAALVAVMATLGTRLPVLWLKHDFSFDGVRARVIARGCAAVVGVSGALVETFHGRPRDRIHVVPPGIPELTVDRSSVRATVLDTLGAPADALVVLLVGRIHPVKGHQEVLSIAADVIGEVPSVRFAFLGGDDKTVAPHGERIRAAIRDLGLADRITITGHRDDPFDFMAGSDLAVIPSVRDDRGFGKEGLPLSAVEMLSVGLPVTGYADGGLPEVVGDCGRLVPPNDRAALRDAITEILSDEATRNEMSRCGRERWAARNRVPEMLERLTTIYERIAR